MRKIILTSLIFLAALQLNAQKTIAIKCGKVFDSRTGNVLTNQIIWIKGNRVDAVTAMDAASLAQLPTRVNEVIDLSDYFVLPGLIDCHTHVLLQGDITSEDYDVQLLKESVAYRTIRATNSCKTALLNGFTTIRDLGTEGAGYADVDLKKAINKGEIIGPRMFVSTLAINTTGHYPIKKSDYNWELNMPKGLQEITGADEARKAARQQIEYGADWIKVYADRSYYKTPEGNYRGLPNFTAEEINAIGDETIRSRKKWLLML